MDSINENLKLIQTHENGNKQAKVYRDAAMGEYRVKLYKDGKHLPKSDYHTDDVSDAHGTAKLYIKENNTDEENQDKLDETTAMDTLKPNSMPADGKSRAGMMGDMMSTMSGMKRSTLIDFFNQSMMQFGPNADLGVPDGTAARNASTIVPKGSPMQEDVTEMFAGTELTEDFKTKISTLVESAVNARVSITIEQLKEQNEVAFTELVEEHKEEISENIDQYLSFAVEEWVKENQVAIRGSLKHEIQESFMTGLHTLFKEHYIDIPEEKVDLLGDMEREIGALKEALNTATNKSIESFSVNEELQRQLVVKDLVKNLTESDALKFDTLIENLSYTDMSNYSDKLSVIKEAHFSGKGNIIKEQEEIIGIETLNEETDNTEEVTGAMAQYINAVSKTVKR
ncbi:MAG: hypothetical protein NTZ20_05550 [Candidatus Levybacteria bacterium]|nr:hypothetical protein [Candidatus Levybacteria bacterium]